MSTHVFDSTPIERQQKLGCTCICTCWKNRPEIYLWTSRSKISMVGFIFTKLYLAHNQMQLVSKHNKIQQWEQTNHQPQNIGLKIKLKKELQVKINM